MRIYKTQQEWIERGYAFCEDCQNFEKIQTTPYGIGACGLTKNRTVFVFCSGNRQEHATHARAGV